MGTSSYLLSFVKFGIKSKVWGDLVSIELTNNGLLIWIFNY